MKVVVLFKEYDWDYYRVKGVYSLEGAKLLKEYYLEIFNKESEETIKDYQNQIVELKEKRRKATHLAELVLPNEKAAKEAGDMLLFKTLHKTRKQYLNEANGYSTDIWKIEYRINELLNMPDENKIIKYMNDNHLYFSETEILEHP